MIRTILILLCACIGIVPFGVKAQDSILKVPPVTKQPHQASPQTEIFLRDTLIIKTQNGEAISFDIELALSPAQQARGLMFRETMPEDSGMLFVFNREAPRSFWMKNTLIPLDMLFIKKDGTIHHIHEHAKPHDLTPVTSMGDALAVLEINGGMADKLGIQKGDIVRHSSFKNAMNE